jgi:outer membrane lipoprotein-sorting protein
MTNFRKTLSFSYLAAALLALSMVRPAVAADDLDKVITRLDASAAKFKSAQADITWDNVQVAPIEDKDSQVGTVVFERKNGQVQMALHIKTDNGKPVLKDMVYADGTGKLYEPRLKQMQVFKLGEKKAQLDTFLTLGFGGSGADLKKNWNVTYAGTESVGGVSAAKLQLVPKDPEVLKSAPKVILWVDLDRGVAVKQQRFDPAGNYVIFSYANLKLNGGVPSNAFEIKTASGTQIVNH